MTPQINSPQLAQLQTPIVDDKGRATPQWGMFFLLTAALMGRFLPTGVFANLPAAAAANQGKFAIVTDSNTVVWGANVAGAGANTVLAWSNGTNWTVLGK